MTLTKLIVDMLPMVIIKVFSVGKIKKKDDRLLSQELTRRAIDCCVVFYDVYHLQAFASPEGGVNKYLHILKW